MTKQDKIHITNFLVRTVDTLSSTIDSETILLHLKNSKYYGMDSTGSRIWELLEHPIEVKSVIQALIKEYEVTEEQCGQDVLIFLTKLLEEKLLEITDA